MLATGDLLRGALTNDLRQLASKTWLPKPRPTYFDAKLPSDMFRCYDQVIEAQHLRSVAGELKQVRMEIDLQAGLASSAPSRHPDS